MDEEAKVTTSSDNPPSFTWESLYAIDDFHPSPHGTLLEAYVLFSTIVGSGPPVYDPSWWSTARYMQPPEEEPLPLPTKEEGELLRRVACQVCGVPLSSEDNPQEDDDGEDEGRSTKRRKLLSSL